MKKSVPSRNHCELCGEEASLYCAADSAFLCFRCDRRVHAANFLVARHVRRLTCPSCHSLAGSGSSAALLSGSDPALPLIRPLCSSCAPDDASSCISSEDESTSTLPPPPRKPWAEACTKRTIAHWSRRIGMEAVAGVAAHVLRPCDGGGGGGGGGGMAVVPPRASMAAAILYAAKVCFCRRGGDRVCGEVVRRLERCSGVPAELILAAESRIARAVRTRARAAAEGWADSECS